MDQIKQLLKNRTVVITGGVIILVVIIIILSKGGQGIIGQNGALGTSEVSNVPISSQDAFRTDLNKVDFSLPVSPQSSKGISAADKKAVYESLLAGYKILTSKNASDIRAYMSIKASTPPEKNLITKMTDADIVSLSSRLAQTMIMPTPDLFLTASSIWTRDGNAVTIQYADPNTGTTTKRVVNINGQWY